MKKRVLIVDDEALIVDLLMGILEKAGYQVFRAYDGRSGFSMAEQQKPHLIISDVVMPEMSGLELIDRLKSVPDLSEIPILLLTQKDDFDSVNRAYDLGATMFLPKPFDSRELLNAVGKILKSS